MNGLEEEKREQQKSRNPMRAQGGRTFTGPDFAAGGR